MFPEILWYLIWGGLITILALTSVTWTSSFSSHFNYSLITEDLIGNPQQNDEMDTVLEICTL